VKNLILSAILAVAPVGVTFAQPTDILNVSYDPTRELYTEFNTAFAKHWKEDSGARGSTITFSERGIGDVLISWENEAYLVQKQKPGDFEIVTPSLSILAEPPVAVVDKNVDRRGTRDVATAYLEYLYTESAQDLIGKHFYRPVSAAAQQKYPFPKLELVTIDSAFGGWSSAQTTFFSDGGIFDQIYQPARR